VDSLNLAGSSGQYWGYFWVMLIQEQPPHRVAWTLEAGSWPCMVIRAQSVAPEIFPSIFQINVLVLHHSGTVMKCQWE
jgi:hypothetical protein